MKRTYENNGTKLNLVAPFVGAWIETGMMMSTRAIGMSHPSWVRGLKQYGWGDDGGDVRSHPSWVRGLKQHDYAELPKILQVAPFVGAWIETTLRIK